MITRRPTCAVVVTLGLPLVLACAPERETLFHAAVTAFLGSIGGV